MTNLQRNFFKRLQEECCVVLSNGTRRSGKTTFMMAVLYEALKIGAFNNYVLILPSYRFTKQYDWILKNKGEASVHIITGYDPAISEDIVKKQTKNRDENMLFVLDDATAYSSYFWNSKDENLMTIISQARHLKVSSWLITHNLKSVISPTIREGVSYLILYDISTMKLLKDMWEEYLSVKYIWNDFKAIWDSHSKREFGAFMLETSKQKVIDLQSNDWPVVVRNRKKI